MKKLKVAIYSGVIPSTTFIENLIKAVASNNIEVYIFGDQRNAVHYNVPGIRIFKRPQSNWLSLPFVTLNILRLRILYNKRYHLIKKHIDSVNPNKNLRFALWQKCLPILFNLPDIFHIQWAKTCDEWLFLKELFGVKLIISLRGVQINYKPLASPTLVNKYKQIFPLIDGFHGVSKDISYRATKYGARPEKTKVVYSGIDINFLNTFQYDIKKNRTATTQLLSIGRMHWNKGYHFAIDSISKVIEKGYNIHYTIVAGLNQEEILYQIEDLKLQSHVTLIKNLPQDKVFELMQKSDLLVLPSFEEGVANVVLESMAIGLPVLSSDCGGMPEVIIHNKTGYLFQNRSHSDFISKLEFAVNDSIDNRISISEAAKQFIKINNSLEGLGRNMSAFYQEVYNRKG